MIICMQCSMKAILNGESATVFDESPEEHMRRYHADAEATARERAELEMRLAQVADATEKSQWN